MKDTKSEFKLSEYLLFKGLNKIGTYNSIREAKNNAPREDGTYNLIGENYRDSWTILNGVLYRHE